MNVVHTHTTHRGGVRAGAGAPAALVGRRLARVLRACVAVVVVSVAGAGLAASSAQAAPLLPFGQLFSVDHDGTFPRQQRIAVDHATGYVLVTNVVADQIDVYAASSDLEVDGALVTSFGSGVLSDPFGVAVDQATGAVYVSDAGNNRIVRFAKAAGDPPVYTLDGGFTGPVQGSAAGEIGSFAASLVIDGAAGKLLVADPGNNRVNRFTLAGGYDGLAFDGADASPFQGGDPDGRFTGLLDLAVDSTGDIVVVDATGNIAVGVGESRVLRFSSAGAYEGRIGADLHRPATVGVRPVDDEVLVTSNQDAYFGAAALQVAAFDSAGTQLATIKFEFGSGSIPSLPYGVASGVAVDDGPFGRIFIGQDVDRVEGNFAASSVKVITHPLPPLLVSEGVVGLTSTRATVVAGVRTMGADTTYRVEYGVVGEGYSQSTPSALAPDGGTGVYPNKQVIKGLLPSTTYQYRFVVDNGLGAPVVGAGGSFTTALALPSVTLGQATDVTPDGVTVSARIDTKGQAGTYGFSLVEVDGPHRVPLAAVPLSAVAGPVNVSARVNGLEAGRKYTVRLYVDTEGGTSFAEPVTFVTAPGSVFDPRPAPRSAEHPYGCVTPHLNAVGARPRAGDLVTVTGSDLGAGGDLAAGSSSPVVTAWSPQAITFRIPADAGHTIPVTVDCGTASNTISIGMAGAPDNRARVVGAVVKGATVRLSVKVPGPGALRITGNNLTPAGASAKKAGTVVVVVKLSSAGKRALAKAKSRQLKVTVGVRYTPTGGTAASTAKSVTFKRGAVR